MLNDNLTILQKFRYVYMLRNFKSVVFNIYLPTLFSQHFYLPQGNWLEPTFDIDTIINAHTN